MDTRTTNHSNLLSTDSIEWLSKEMIYASYFGLLIAVFYFLKPLSNQPKPFPIAGIELGSKSERQKHYTLSAESLLKQSYNKFKDRVFRVNTIEKDWVVIPPKYLDEVKPAIDDSEAINAALADALSTKYTLLDPSNNTRRSHIIRADLTPHIQKIIPDVRDELQYALATELPPCEDWTAININQKLLRIVALISGRVFVGPELCRNEDWIKMSIGYTVDAMTASRAVKRWPLWIQPFTAPFIPEVGRIKGYLRKAKAFMEPILRARLENQQKPGYQKPNDMIQWVLDNSTAEEAADSEFAALEQLILSFAAIHTTTMTSTQIFYDLVAMPEYIQPLREEITQVLANNDGKFTKASMEQMKKLDSFMRESQRHNPIEMTLIRRKLFRSITLSDGSYLPAGTSIAIPTNAMMHDPENVTDPEKFDGLRSYNRRQRGGLEANRDQFVSVSRTSMGFGYGKHSCPGRFFAANEIKLILANLLMNYDVKIVGEEGVRYPNIHFETMCIADPTKEILLKRISHSQQT